MLFAVRSSRTYVLMLLAVHLLAIICIEQTKLVLWARLCIMLLILFSLLHQLYRHMRAGWCSFSLDQKRVVINTPDGHTLEGELTHQSLVIAWCVVLCVRLAGHRLPVCQVIFPDAMQAEDFRELRVRLRFV